jgi:integrase
MPSPQYTRVEDHIWRYKARGQDRFLVRITVERQAHTEKGLESLLEARQRRDSILRAQAIPVRMPKPPTLKDAAGSFLTACEGRGLSTTTIVNYRNGLEHLCEKFGVRRCDRITREELRRFLQAKMAGVPTGTASRFPEHTFSFGTMRTHFCAPLFQIFEQLVEDGRLSSNPMRGLQRTLGRVDEAVKVEVDPFTEEEIRRILEASRPPRQIPALPGRRHPRVAYVEWMVTNLLAHTGMRSGEAFALLIPDLDLDRRRVSVSKTFRQTHGLNATTKGRRSRWVDLTPSLVIDLRAYVEWLHLEAAADGRVPMLLFPDRSPRGIEANSKRITDTGERYLTLSTYASYFWYPLLSVNNLPKKNPHQLRHTYATLLIGKGVGIEYVSHQLGHSSLAITDKVYNHYKPPVSETRGVDLLELGR